MPISHDIAPTSEAGFISDAIAGSVGFAMAMAIFREAPLFQKLLLMTGELALSVGLIASGIRTNQPGLVEFGACEAAGFVGGIIFRLIQYNNRAARYPQLH